MCWSILWCLHFIVKMSGLLHVLYVLYAGFWDYIFLYGCIFITKCKLWINKICYKAYGFSYCYLLDFENIYYMFVV